MNPENTNRVATAHSRQGRNDLQRDATPKAPSLNECVRFVKSFVDLRLIYTNYT